jgi:hypothetical protein
MCALPQALPLAISASFYPPALLVLLLLTGKHPRRLVLSYFAGAGLLNQCGPDCARAVEHGRVDHPEFEHGQRLGLHPDRAVAAGVGRVGAAAKGHATLMRAKARARGVAAGPRSVAAGDHEPEMGVRPRLGHVPPLIAVPALAVKDIADSGDSSSSNVTAVLICAIGVMLFVEIPLVAMFIRPGGVAEGSSAFTSGSNATAGLSRPGWR